MKIRIPAALCLLVLVAGCRVIEPPPAPVAPRIDSFTANKTRTAPGEEVTLTFSTTGATKLELFDDSGKEVQLEGSVESGTATVGPTRPTFYVLRATGAGGRDTAFVQIAVDEPLKDLFLIAVPAALDSGEEGQLLWGAPGASSVTLTTAGGAPQPLTGSTGSVIVTPAFTERYTLTAQGAPGTPPLTAIAEISVHPVLSEAALLTPDGVQPGQTITFTWTARGAHRLTITEPTLGQLTSISDPAAVASGSFDYVVPLTLPNGIALSDGLMLNFAISASAGELTVSKPLGTVVGNLPAIERLLVPESASAGREFPVSWRTVNATQITISVGGLTIYQTLPGAQATVDEGSLTLPVPPTMTEYTFTASNERTSVSRVFNVRPVPLPVITSFTLTSAITTLGEPATARWTTTGASRVQLRLENGGTLAIVTSPSQVASGTAVITPATSVRVALEAFNPAGDVVSQVKTITFASSTVTVGPNPVVRGEEVTVTWDLAAAGVLETVGLPTPAAAPITGSTAFLDLAALPTATELIMPDTANGAGSFVPPDGFHFPLLGNVSPELFVSVNGFLAFAPPAALSGNLNMETSSTPPSMLAPLWDDLLMGPDSKVLYALQTNANGERFLVVQWEKFQKVGDASSEFTFQAHMYETGQVTFLYKTLTGTLSSVTIGVNDDVSGTVRQYTYNSTTVLPAVGLELNYFNGGPATGSLPFLSSTSPRVEFFGRTGTGVIPISGEVRSFGPGDVSISEVMPFPEVSVASTGQWVELRNNADASVDFEGLRVSSTGSSPDGGYVLIGAGSVVPPYGYLVIGQSTNSADNGGAPVVQAATDLPLTTPESVRVSLQTTTIGALLYDGGTTGSSLQLIEDMLVASGQSTICGRTPTRTFGTSGALGTPGDRNEPCAPYVVTSIPGGFLPAPAGSEILGTIISDNGYGAGTLPAPFTYFGVAYTTFGLSTNGLITLGAPALTTSYPTNNTAVSTSAPNGVLAVFWDDLVRDTGKNAMWRLSDRTIITWENFRLSGTLATNTQINVQIHLLDSGVIEFHYGALATTLTTQTTIDRVAGNSATVWLERPDGVVAVPWRINQLNGVVPNSGLRFTPVP